MGGDEGSSSIGSLLESAKPRVSSCGDDEGAFSTELQNGDSTTIEESGFNFEASLAAEKQRLKICAQILMSYEESLPQIERVNEAKNKILSYKPGSWIDRAGEHNVPDAATLLLIGPKGSGKSSLINKISRAFEVNTVRSDRAQVSYNYFLGEGTYFLCEYMIPKALGSLCLYDTRSLSFDSSENRRMVEHWMTKGVRHGELVARTSDDTVLKAQLKSKARRSACSSRFRTVSYVIFVVNGVSVLESLDGINGEMRRYLQMIAESYKNPLLSYKDEKPVVVLTHGDLLTVSDRVRVRVLLGDLLCVHPRTHIFDIPENDGLDTKLEVFEMLLHCLEHADRNLPASYRFNKVNVIYFSMIILFVAVIFKIIFDVHNYVHQKPVESQNIEWHKIRHLWSE